MQGQEQIAIRLERGYREANERERAGYHIATVNQFNFEAPVYFTIRPEMPPQGDNTAAWLALAGALAPLVLPLLLPNPKRSGR